MHSWTRKILLVEDAPLMGSLIESLLTREGFEVKTCTSASRARDIASDFDPDLAILDVNLGEGISGVQLGYILEQTHPTMAIMYLTQYTSAFLSDPGSAAHVKNKVVLSKDEVTSPNELLVAIEAALRGSNTSTSSEPDIQMQRLTSVQWEILQLMASGFTNTAIAQHRGTSERAVEKQLKVIYQHLEITGDKLSNARVLATRRFLEVTGGASSSVRKAHA